MNPLKATHGAIAAFALAIALNGVNSSHAEEAPVKVDAPIRNVSRF